MKDLFLSLGYQKKSKISNMIGFALIIAITIDITHFLFAYKPLQNSMAWDMTC